MIVARKFGTLEELEIFMQAGIVGGLDLFKKSAGPGGQEVWGLDGKTIVFTTPSATVTLDTDPEGSYLSIQDIISQIDTQTSNAVKPRLFRGRLVLIEGTPTNGLVVTGASTALDLLGFDKGGFTTKLLNSDGSTTPYIISLQQTHDNYFFLVTEE
jgi:hypothetical protein